ncbi:MAG: FxLYD domain-containing protein [Clostridiaceae bacterium]|nr:FxLYD domain-containing protein [Clostridiaceae bacterium]
MKKLEKVIDINSHIENLKCEVNNENGNLLAKISFDNMGYGDIIAIKFNACGYNMFGDVVFINGKDKFLLVLQDINIPRNESAVNLKVKLPEDDIRKLDIVESQICFADGSIVTYKGDQSFSVLLEEYDNLAVIAALHKLYTDKAKYKFKNFEQGWICTCGRFNTHETTKCTLCGKRKVETEKICSEEGMKNLIEEYRISEERDIKAKEEAKQIAIAMKKEQNIMKVIVVVVCIALAIIFGIAIIKGGRATYSSEEEMKDAVKGSYTCYNISHGEQYIIKIDENYITKRWVNLGSDYDKNFRIESWNPKKGTITASSGDYFILNNSNIKDEDGNKYESGGYWSDSQSNSSSSSYNYSSYSYISGYTDLDINSLYWDNNSSYNVYTGKVTNNGNKTYYFVTVKGSFKDSSGKVLDTDSSYAVGAEGLEPGESSSFRLSVDYDSRIKECSVSILDFD